MYNHEVGSSFFMSDGSIDPVFWTYFKTQKVCTDAVTEGCWHSTFYALNGGTATIRTGRAILAIKNAAILANGTLIGMTYMSPTVGIALFGVPTVSNCGNLEVANLPTYGYSGDQIVFFIDVNGFKQPNRVGKDIYIAYSIETYFLKVPSVSAGYGDPAYYDSCKCYGLSCSYNTLIGD